MLYYQEVSARITSLPDQLTMPLLRSIMVIDQIYIVSEKLSGSWLNFLDYNITFQCGNYRVFQTVVSWRKKAHLMERETDPYKVYIFCQRKELNKWRLQLLYYQEVSVHIRCLPDRLTTPLLVSIMVWKQRYIVG